MIYKKLSGNYPNDTVGILGLPNQPGLVTSNGQYMASANNAFAETQQMRNSNPRLFNTNCTPPYPEKYVYNFKKMASRHRTRQIKDLHTIVRAEATAPCTIYYPGPLRNFCVDDVVMTGDLDSSKDGFYEQNNTYLNSLNK